MVTAKPRTISSTKVRLRLTISGQVQGVGFRPFVYRLARQLGLAGYVNNTSGGATEEIEGQADFSRDDIRSRFITAREPTPGNFPRDFAVALKNGWIAEVHGKKNRFYVTAKGAQAINNNFSSGKGAAARR